MTPAQAILIGAVLIGGSIMGARLIAPYEIAPGVDAQGNPFLWRANAITGDVQICPALNVIRHAAGAKPNPFDKDDPDKILTAAKCQ